MTYEEFLDRVDEDTHAEWVNGEMVMPSPVSDDHQDIGLFLLGSIAAFVEEKLLGGVRYESYQMKLNVSGREPDILFIAEAHRDRLTGTYLNGPADRVVEIVSPESQTRDRVNKHREYEQGGVREYWLIDPLYRTAEFYQLDENGVFQAVLPNADGLYHSAVLEGLWLRVDWLWQRPLPRLLDVLREWNLI